MRVELSLLDFAIVRTCVAILAGKLTLWRTVFGSATFISPLCTSLMRHPRVVQRLPSGIRWDCNGRFSGVALNGAVPLAEVSTGGGRQGRRKLEACLTPDT